MLDIKFSSFLIDDIVTDYGYNIADAKILSRHAEKGKWPLFILPKMLNYRHVGLHRIYAAYKVLTGKSIAVHFRQCANLSKEDFSHSNEK